MRGVIGLSIHDSPIGTLVFGLGFQVSDFWFLNSDRALRSLYLVLPWIQV